MFMANKAKFLKSLLTTASVLAVMTGVAETAVAAVKTTLANPSNFHTKKYWNPSGVVKDNDTLKSAIPLMQ